MDWSFSGLRRESIPDGPRLWRFAPDRRAAAFFEGFTSGTLAAAALAVKVRGGTTVEGLE
jgi:hypothetical protein